MYPDSLLFKGMVFPESVSIFDGGLCFIWLDPGGHGFCMQEQPRMEILIERSKEIQKFNPGWR
jgi:hypothetical protein